MPEGGLFSRRIEGLGLSHQIGICLIVGHSISPKEIDSTIVV